jgi:transposase-like protein
LSRKRKDERDMKKGQKAKPEEIIKILRKVEIHSEQGDTIPLACKRAGISEQSYYRWRKQYGGMQTSQAKEFKKLQKENSKLKKIVADLTLEKMVLSEVVSGKF